MRKSFSDPVIRKIFKQFVYAYHPVDVPRTIRKDLIDGHFDHVFGTRKLRHETRIVRDLSASIHAKPPLLFEINEEHPDMRIDSEISQAHERAVAIVVREQERFVVDNPHKPGNPSSIVASRS